MKLQTGAIAPLFTTKDTTGKDWSLANALTQGWVLLIFYPGDDTAVCTKQLCDYRDNWQQLSAYGATIVGISTDDHDSHVKFSSKHSFPFPLLDDSSKEICRQYDMLSVLGMSQRGFVLISPEGRAEWVFRESLMIFRRKASEVAEELKKHVPLRKSLTQ